MTTIALFGAGGKIGFRCVENLKDAPYKMLYLEVSSAGIERLAREGLSVTPQDRALRDAEVVILAVPDNLIGSLAREIAPGLRPSTMIIVLDAAVAYAGGLPARSDISCFVAHPCHPAFPIAENDPEARKDFFGGNKARQNIVCSLMRGPESHYATGEAICRRVFAPVAVAHRLEVEQIAMLEPALAETVSATCIVAIHEAMNEVIRRGVPAQVARDFILGHINVSVATVFGMVDAEFSDGCKLTIRRAQRRIFRPDWKEVFEKENIRTECMAIAENA